MRRQSGDKLQIIATLNCLGRVTRRQGYGAAAASLHNEALVISKGIGDQDGIGHSLSGLADVTRVGGDEGAALALYRKSLSIFWNLGEKPEWLAPLESVAAVMLARGQHELSVRLWSAAQALRDDLTVPVQSTKPVNTTGRLATRARLWGKRSLPRHGRKARPPAQTRRLPRRCKTTPRSRNRFARVPDYRLERVEDADRRSVEDARGWHPIVPDRPFAYTAARPVARATTRYRA